MSPEVKRQPAVRVAIVGCGQIGSRWDAPSFTSQPDTSPSSSANTPASLTHAAAFTRHEGAEVVAFCDADRARADEAAARWGVPAAHDDVSAMLRAVSIDVLVVATVSAVRNSVVEAALAAGVKTFVIEKPLATTLAESRQLVQRLEDAGAQALVNYLRHWDVAMADLRERRRQGQFGVLQRLLGLYGKGLSNNGSHLTDLAGLLCDAQPVRARALGSPLPASEADWSAGADPAIDAQVLLRMADGAELQLDLLATDASAFSCFELRLIGTRAMAQVSQGGRRIEWTPIIADPHFAGYRIPGAAQRLPSGLLQAMDGMADEAVRMVRAAKPGGHPLRPSCSARDALRTASTVDAIRQSARAGGVWIPIA